MGLEQQAVNLGVPRGYETDKPSSGNYSRTFTTTPVYYAVPAAWRGCYVSIAATGADLVIAFGGANLVIIAVQDSGLVGEVLTPHASTPEPVFAGTKDHFRMPDDLKLTRFGIAGITGSGRWYMRLAEGIGG